MGFRRASAPAPLGMPNGAGIFLEGGFDRQGRFAYIPTLDLANPDQTVSARQSRAAWERLLAKVYEVHAFRCNRCGSPMKVLAVILAVDLHEFNHFSIYDEIVRRSWL